MALAGLAHALLEAGYLTVAAPARAGCGRITQLAKDDVIEDSRATRLVIDAHRFMLPTRLAHLVRQLRDHAHVGQRTADDRGGIGSQKLTNLTR